MRYIVNIILSIIAVVVIIILIVPALICIAFWGRGYAHDPLNGDYCGK